MEFLYTYVRRPIFFSKPNVVRDAVFISNCWSPTSFKLKPAWTRFNYNFLLIFSFFICIKAGGPFQIIKTLRLPFWKRSPIRDIKVVHRAFYIVVYYYVLLGIILLIIEAILFHPSNTYLFWFVFYLSYFVLVP